MNVVKDKNLSKKDHKKKLVVCLPEDAIHFDFGFVHDSAMVYVPVEKQAYSTGPIGLMVTTDHPLSLGQCGMLIFVYYQVFYD